MPSIGLQRSCSILTVQLEVEGRLSRLREVGVDGLTAEDTAEVLSRHVVLRVVVLDDITSVGLGGVVHYGVIDQPADSRLRFPCAANQLLHTVFEFMPYHIPL